MACVGGRLQRCGSFFSFNKRKIEGAKIDIFPIEPASCPSLTKGPFAYDFGDTAGMTPILPMYTLGHTFMPSPSHAGGLRYHGMAPLVSAAARQGLLRPQAISQVECFSAAVQFARSEGIIVAPETSHAVAQVIREAIKAREEQQEKVILFGLSGHGLLDLQGYAEYFAGKSQILHSPNKTSKNPSLRCQRSQLPQNHSRDDVCRGTTMAMFLDSFWVASGC